jgi:hypothetical protein
MAKKQRAGRAKPADAGAETPTTPPPAERRVTRADTLIALMRADGGATAAELGAAVGWQVHSVRGFIAGTLKKRSDLAVTAVRENGVTRYRILDVAAVTA